MSALGRGYDEVTGALREAGVPFLVLCAPKATRALGGDRSARIGIWIPDSSSTVKGLRSFLAEFLRSAPGPFSTEWMFGFERWGRPFAVSFKPLAQFEKALKAAQTDGHLGSPAPLADPGRLATFLAQEKASEEMLAEEQRSRTEFDEAVWERRVRTMIREQTGRDVK